MDIKYTIGLAIEKALINETAKLTNDKYINKITEDKKFLKMNIRDLKNATIGFFVFNIISGAQNIVIKEMAEIVNRKRKFQ